VQKKICYNGVVICRKHAPNEKRQKKGAKMNQRWQAIGLVIFGSIVYGFVSIAIKFAYGRGFSFTDVLGMQMLSGFVLLLALLAAVTYSGVIAASGRIAVEVNPWMRSLVMNSSMTLLVWALFRPAAFTDGALSGGLWYWGLLIACCSVLIPNVCFAAGTPKIGAALAGILSSVELPATVFLSWALLQETVTPAQWIGNAIILGGIAATRFKLRRKKEASFRVSEGQSPINEN
jgi:drug/metabolite transporter (DMT)-like permease